MFWMFETKMIFIFQIAPELFHVLYIITWEMWDQQTVLSTANSVYQPPLFQFSPSPNHCKVKLFQLYCFSSGQVYGLFILTFPWKNTKMTQIRGCQIVPEQGNISAFSVSKHVIDRHVINLWFVGMWVCLYLLSLISMFWIHKYAYY